HRAWCTWRRRRRRSRSRSTYGSKVTGIRSTAITSGTTDTGRARPILARTGSAPGTSVTRSLRDTGKVRAASLFTITGGTAIMIATSRAADVAADEDIADALAESDARPIPLSHIR